ncbi:bifunctional PTS system maltose and glucose-specific transporter subunits IICB [Serratia fonticola]|uniref:Bifunctional PTS system maltose and glucose-specific transporter subunits IICB n=1 Tax=Serratia fonticola TaxID=47917 RepID=A0A4U9WDE1_SERFO|nr:bifunctional PTS system maltose and glucose-specific transporter subunits IICB [Serratia fonticola]
MLPTVDPLVLKANNIQNILGIQSIDTGILGAVIVGIIVYLLHERFQHHPPAGCAGVLRRYPLCPNRHHRGTGPVRPDYPADLALVRCRY